MYIVDGHQFQRVNGANNTHYQALENHHNETIQKKLLDNLHPDVVENIRKSLQLTFVNMLTEHAKTATEIQSIKAEFSRGSNFGSW